MNNKQQSDNLLKVIDEMEDYAFFFLDLSGNIQSWNLGAQKIKGYTADEILGKSFEYFYTKEDIDNEVPKQLLESAIKHGKAFVEGWRIKKDGTDFWGSVLITAIHNNHGEVIGFGKLTRDLTNKRIIEQLTEEYCEKLKEMLHMTSHRVRSPLAKCLGLFSVIEHEDTIDEKELKKILNHLKTSAIELNNFTEELTAYMFELEKKYRK